MWKTLCGACGLWRFSTILHRTPVGESAPRGRSFPPIRQRFFSTATGFSPCRIPFFMKRGADAEFSRGIHTKSTAFTQSEGRAQGEIPPVAIEKSSFPHFPPPLRLLLLVFLTSLGYSCSSRISACARKTPPKAPAATPVAVPNPKRKNPPPVSRPPSPTQDILYLVTHIPLSPLHIPVPIPILI